MRAALAAVFSAALGYGTLLPLVPVYLGAAGGGDVTWHSGALPAAFLVAAAICAPAWGHVSDRAGRRTVIASGAGGAILAVVPFFMRHGLAQLYAFQALAGVSFGAVVPAALALVYETGDARSRPRRIGWYGTVLLGGYLVGPALGGWLAGLAESGARLAPHQIVQLALGIQAAAAALALGVLYFGAPSDAAQQASEPRIQDRPEPAHAAEALVALVAAMLTAFLLGGFEIMTVLHLRTALGLGSSEVAVLFIACGTAMALIQLFIMPHVPERAARPGPGLALVGLSGMALAAMPLARTYASTIVLGAAIGGTLGLAFGILALGMASVSGARRGLALGAQNAAIAAGQAAGSIFGAALFPLLASRAFPLLAGAVTVATLLLAAFTTRTGPVRRQS